MYVLKITRLKKIIALIIRALKQHIEDTSPVEADMVPEVVIKRYDFFENKMQRFQISILISEVNISFAGVNFELVILGRFLRGVSDW